MQRSTAPLYTLLALPDAEGVLLIRREDIRYCQAEGNYTRVSLGNGRQILVTRKLKELEERLVDNIFVRVHNSYIVNLRYVERYLRGDGGSLKLEDNLEIPVARNKKSALLELFKKM